VKFVTITLLYLTCKCEINVIYTCNLFSMNDNVISSLGTTSLSSSDFSELAAQCNVFITVGESRVLDITKSTADTKEMAKQNSFFWPQQ